MFNSRLTIRRGRLYIETFSRSVKKTVIKATITQQFYYILTMTVGT